MDIAICDDEKNICEMLAKKVKKLLPDAVIECFSSGEELLNSTYSPQILFLDIQMPGKNGMETARQFRRNHKDTVLIFVTAAEEYVFQAFDVGAFHYLVKPFSDEKFAEVLGRAKELADKGAKVKGQSRSVLVSIGGTHRKVYFKDIVYAEVFNRKIMIHTIDETIEYYGKLSDLEKLAGESYFRPHRAYLVNLQYVVKYDASSITLERGKVIMAKAKYPEFVKAFLHFTVKGKENG